MFGKKKAPGPPPPSLGEASSGMNERMTSMDGEQQRPRIARGGLLRANDSPC